MTHNATQYDPETLFTDFATRFPHLGARGCRDLTDAVTFRYAQNERVFGVLLCYGHVPLVVTDRAAYVQWPAPQAEEVISLDNLPELDCYALLRHYREKHGGGIDWEGSEESNPDKVSALL